MARRVERTRAGSEWTEARYWSFVRSALRQASRRYPPIARLALDAVKRPNESSNKRMKWEYQCAECGDWFPRKEVQVDHIIACGSLKTYEDLPGFVERLFCEPNDLAVLCRKCHQDKTNNSGGAK